MFSVSGSAKKKEICKIILRKTSGFIKGFLFM